MAARTRPLNVLFAALAGVGAFYGAVQVSGRLSGAADAHDAIVEPVVRAPRVVATAAPVVAAASAAARAQLEPGFVLGNRERAIPGRDGDAFANLQWLPPARPAPAPVVVAAPPPPAPAAPAPAPVAPPMPFAFVGMLEKGALKPQAFLSKGDALLVVAAGDLLENKTYRVDSLTPQELVMTYLPLNIKQSINVTGGTK